LKEQPFKKKKVGVMMGGLSREREISLKTGKAILKPLLRRGTPFIPSMWDLTSQKFFSRKRLNVPSWHSMEDTERMGAFRECSN